MSKERIKQKYQNCELGYGAAISLLINIGFTEYAADQYLFSE